MEVQLDNVDPEVQKFFDAAFNQYQKERDEFQKGIRENIKLCLGYDLFDPNSKYDPNNLSNDRKHIRKHYMISNGYDPFHPKTRSCPLYSVHS